jgi:hypothetical protein
MKKSKLQQIIKEEINNILSEDTPVNKELLKQDIEKTILQLKQLSPKITFDDRLSRFASGSKSEVYIKIYYNNDIDLKNFIDKVETTFINKGVGKSGIRSIYQDKINKTHFRIVKKNDKEASIIFNRNFPKGM